MIDKFAQILWRMPMGDTYSSDSHSGGVTSFKVQVKFDIPILEGQIDADIVDRQLNLLKGYLSVHDFSDQENFTFAHLKVAPHVKEWWETQCDKKDKRETSNTLHK